ncbi:MAG: DUF362 domain-containing protein [Candidatus Bathyarchaeota archaeon]|nr:DUF362 domain-containing protein [Candidatus Bathyarchaeota archaeon]
MTAKPQTVRIYKTKEHSVSDILQQAVKDAQLQGKQRIFIKPNLSHPEYLPGVVTDPKLTEELIGLLRDKASEVVVGESNGFNYPCRLAFEKTGMEAAVKRAGAKVVNLSEDQVVKVKFSKGERLKELFLPKTLMDSDVVVDLPLMKTHEFMAYSGALKNLFGCVPSNRRIYLHPYLPEVFYRLYTLFKPKITIMDARTGIEGNGPTKGKPVQMNLMLTGTDALATDIVTAQVMGLNWKNTYLHYIAKKTSFPTQDIKVEGAQISEVMRHFEPPKIDLPVKAQIEIYKHEYLTKLFFCSLDVVKLFQKVTKSYRGEAVEVA